MYEKILITGIPGTGKTSVANKLGKFFKTPVIHITDFVKKHDLIIEEKRGTIVVDMEMLRKALNVEKGIIEGHLACEFKLRNSFVIVLRCDPKILKQRMKKRGYPPKKTKENLECEALDYCTIKAEEYYKKVFEVDTTDRTIQKVVDECVEIIKGRSEGDKVDFSGYLLK